MLEATSKYDAMTDTSPFNNFACECGSCLHMCDPLVDSSCHCALPTARSKQRSWMVITRILAFLRRFICNQWYDIDHNYPKQHSIIILVPFQESIWSMPTIMITTQLCSKKYATPSCFKHDSCLLPVKRINLQVNDQHSVTVVVKKEQNC